jgi:hypothetical protein
LPCTDQILAKLKQAGGITLCSEICRLTTSIWNRKNCHTSGRDPLLYLFIKRVIKLTNNYRRISLLPTTYKILSNILVSRVAPYVEKIIWDHNCGFQHNRPTDKRFCIWQILGRKWVYNRTAHQLFTDFQKAYDLLRREVLYNILVEFGVPMKVVG